MPNGPPNVRLAENHRRSGRGPKPDKRPDPNKNQVHAISIYSEMKFITSLDIKIIVIIIPIMIMEFNRYQQPFQYKQED
jgi:hypothetical protein